MVTMTETNAYYYKGKKVRIIPGQQFDSHWNIEVSQPTKDGGSIKKIIAVIPRELTQNKTSSIPIIGNPESKAINNESHNLLLINEASFIDIRKQLPGVGRVTANSFIKNRPEIGYANIEQMKELNKTVKVNWEEISKIISFNH